MSWGGLCILATLLVLGTSNIGFSLAGPTFYRDDQFLMDHPLINEEMTTKGLLFEKDKRAPVLGFGYQPQRSRISWKPTPAAIMEEDRKGKNELDIKKLNMTIRKLQMLDATLIRKYAGRLKKANKDSLTENPIWLKLWRLRILIRKLMKVYKENTSQLDTTRMKK